MSSRVSFSNFRIYSYTCNSLYVDHPGFLLGLENLEKWEGILESGNFEQTGKSGIITQNTGNIRETRTSVIYFFLVIFK